ncbi:sensor histidine kinase [Oceanirhabdus sp. W0125-5]|uniref:sensor histidine kinase n=1 Tax=Oceanirhabdus sp. W0125-5 TaxID=2999116 RepID=UPI0022F2E3F9|nr:HAMP domain-containing sensor histidine kinase [Oceanirhabdus sp. W0125-5]WBW97418.1 HAMP domain-containing sensor histidine kinase [Oceanirhabdus sp. W0125-5]
MVYLLLIVTMIVFTRLFLIKREIKCITRQLQDYNGSKSRKKIDLQFFDKSLENLAYRINENLDIANERLVKQRASEDELKRAIAYVSHDLRTPLTTILGCFQMINKENISEERKKEYLYMAEKRGERLQELLSEFFELSTVESPDYKINLEYLNLNSVLCNTIAGFYEKITKKGIEPDIYLGNENIDIIGDISAVNRILENIISNAIKYCEGELNIILEKRESKAIVIVENTSKHLNQIDINKIFEKFYTGEKSRNIEEASIGLGLPIAKKLIEKLGGTISCSFKNDIISMKCEFLCVENS